MTKRRWVLPAVAAVIGFTALAGCQSGTVHSSDSATPPPAVSSAPVSVTPPISSAPVSAPPTAPSTAVSSPPRTSISPTPTSAPPTTSAPTTTAPTPPPAPQSTCHSLTIRVIRGSGAPGYELAALDFVNTGKASCVLIGVPTVTLLRGGVQVGTVSKPSSAAAALSRYRLAPGAVGESRLKDFSTCQAPLSDEIKAVAPGSTISTTRPGQLRACALRVYPLTAPE
jgi:hypothetical protein